MHKKKLGVLAFLFIFVLFIGTSMSQDSREPEGKLLPEETRESLKLEFFNNPDFKEYPNLLNYIVKLINHDRRPLEINEQVAGLLGGNGQWTILLDLEDLKTLLQACSDDGVTTIRAMIAIALVCRRTNTLIYSDGRHVERALNELHLSPGLGFATKNLRLAAFIPDEVRGRTDKEFQCHSLSVYDKKFTHRFRKEVIDANLKIGTGDTATLVDIFSENEGSWKGYMVKSVAIYSSERFGFLEVTGIGGEKRGKLGFLQRILFFLPDAIDGMIVNKKGDLITMAFMKTEIKNFEWIRKYQVHRIGELPWEEEIPAYRKKGASFTQQLIRIFSQGVWNAHPEFPEKR